MLNIRTNIVSVLETRIGITLICTIISVTVLAVSMSFNRVVEMVVGVVVICTLGETFVSLAELSKVLTLSIGLVPVLAIYYIILWRK